MVNTPSPPPQFLSFLSIFLLGAELTGSNSYFCCCSCHTSSDTQSMGNTQIWEFTKYGLRMNKWERVLTKVHLFCMYTVYLTSLFSSLFLPFLSFSPLPLLLSNYYVSFYFFFYNFPPYIYIFSPSVLFHSIFSNFYFFPVIFFSFYHFPFYHFSYLFSFIFFLLSLFSFYLLFLLFLFSIYLFFLYPFFLQYFLLPLPFPSFFSPPN